jgi:EAL domain-containing protein (putative c-di-GMP-specific phosphodiesterase class I)
MPDHEEVTIILEQLTGALARGEMELHFQPEIDLTTGSVTAMEALIRWAHPGRGMLWPADFLAVAEEGGLTPALGAWVLSRALQEARHFAPGTRIWVNVSGAELADPRYPVRLQQALTGLGSAAGVIGVDLPDGALVTLGPRAAEICGQLRAAGAALALEYSGAYPGLIERLGALGVEIVKINRSLVRGIDTDDDRRRDIEVLVRSAALAGVSVTAGGVESWAEAQRLQQLGVLRAHGFLLSPPMRADRIRWALGRGDMGRGSYLQDGSGWLTSSRYAAALHDVLPRGGAPEPGGARSAPRSAASKTRSQSGSSPWGSSQSGTPAPQLTPPPIRPQRAGAVPGVIGADPFGRREARPLKSTS